MKAFKNIIQGLIWTLLGLYLSTIVLLQIPTVQRFIGGKVSDAISQKLGTRCEVGRVDLGFMNRLIVDDLSIYDQSDSLMLRVSRLSVKADILPLIADGKISISSAQLFGMNGHFYKKDAQTPANYQFALDSLASKDTTKHTPLDLQIRSLIVRHGSIRYDRYDAPPVENISTSKSFDINHLALSDISAHVAISKLTDDNVDVNLKRLAFKEQSGIDLRKVSFRLTADKQRACLHQLGLELPNSSILADSLVATYRFQKGKLDKHTLQFKGNILPSSLTPSDLASLIPALKSFQDAADFSFSINGTHRQIALDNLHLKALDGEVLLHGNATLGNLDSTPRWFADLKKMSISTNAIDYISTRVSQKNIHVPDELTRLGDVSFEGHLGGMEKNLFVEGILHTDAGNADVGLDLTDDLSNTGKNIDARLKTDGINIKRITGNDAFGNLVTDIRMVGKMNGGQIESLVAKGKVSQFDYNNYCYQNIDIDGTIKGKSFDGTFMMDDPNGSVQLDGNVVLDEAFTIAKGTASVRNFRPKGLHLTDAFGNSTIDADIDANITGKSLSTMEGAITINNFDISTQEGTSTPSHYHLDYLQIDADNRGNTQQVSMVSDFGIFNLKGQFDYTTLAQSVINQVGAKLPTLPGLPAHRSSHPNYFTIDADIEKTDWLQSLLGVDLVLNEPFHLSGFVNDNLNQLSLDLKAPRWSYNGNDYANANVSLKTSPVGELIASAHIRKEMESGRPLDLTLNANAANNELITSLHWDNNGKRPIVGTLNSTTQFFKNERGKPAAHMRIHRSDVHVNDTVWHIQPSDIVYSNRDLLVDYFAIEHDKQHIIVTGRASDNPLDSLIADLQNVNVQYILDLVNFTSVSFNGYATGKAIVKSAFKNPDAHANLRVDNFRFQTGRMGTLFADAYYNKEDKQIDIHAHAEDEDAQTLVDGYVSPTRNHIDLSIAALNSRLEFLEKFCGSFMSNVEARGSGMLRLHGDLKNINLTGLVVADGKLDIKTLGTRYTLRNDTIRLDYNEIVLQNDTIYDEYGNMGIVNGALHHDHLRRLTYDINIAANHLLCYDFPSYGDNTFFGTVYGTGQCTITGRSGRIDFDINATPNRGSFIEYNAASPDAITDQQFITWRDRTLRDSLLTPQSDLLTPSLWGYQGSYAPPTETDMRINFLFNINPDFTLRVLMDKATGDHIALNGTGAIRASYYNKGSFDMFGTFLVQQGVYKLTIQNVIKRDFQFQQGGTINFAGNAYDATLQLPAIHTLNAVSLSDLQMGRSFTSNNVRVDCLMNITGTPLQPHVEFDIDLPTVNADARQMVRQLINSEEEMNQQVIYLLAIGRFYNQSVNVNSSAADQQSQTSLAMQSLLSGTISQQINNVLGTIVNNPNWNLGANISTGDEGFYNAEYEGLLSGRLLNNRLIINGQFGYRDNPNATSSFIGDFDIRYLLLPNGNLALKVYNQTNDRYFTRNSLNTQGIGIIMKKDFSNWRDLLGIPRRKEN